MAVSLRPLLLLGLLPLVAGCAWFQPADKPAWVSRLRRPAPQSDDARVALDLAILEKPLGDPFMNRDLWRSTDDMVIDLEKKDLLEKNGYRVGQVVGLTPEALQALLKSERYCVNPRRRIVPDGGHVTQYLGPVFPESSFTLHESEREMPLNFDQVRFCLDIVATRAKDGKIRLTFTPKVETGERVLPFQPDVDRSTWTLCVDKPYRVFPSLSWEVTVEPNKFVVIGASLERGETVGHRSLVQEEYPPRQRLLVIRAATNGGAETAEEPKEAGPTGTSLALQASGGGS